MIERIAFIGAPSSAGAYAPGQEKAPSVLRHVGLIANLEEAGVDCADFGDTARFRWRVDPGDRRAMNVKQAARTANEVAALVRKAGDDDRMALVVGGDCTVEIGSVAGVASHTSDLGLVYFDLDADMNTPQTTSDGALDWMGVAHMLGLPDVRSELSEAGPYVPLLQPRQVMLFGAENIKACEQEWIDRLDIHLTTARAVASDPTAAAAQAVEWASQFDRALIHLDVDVMDFEDFPIAENTRRKRGLSFERTMKALDTLLQAPNLAALTICEINPDHGLENDETVRAFAERLAASITGGSRER